jgi:hypothetical protein
VFDCDEWQYKTPNWSLTAEELKSYKGYENVSDEEAERVIETLVRLAVIVYHSK